MAGIVTTLEVWSDVDPRDLRINKKFRNNPYLPPGVSRAQDHLIIDIKRQIPDDYVPCQECNVTLRFFYPNNRTDVDGPIKRTLDAIEKALKAKGYETWHDGKVIHLHVSKLRSDPGSYPNGIEIIMQQI